MAKTHIMRWAPQDYRTSRVRARSATTKDPMLRLIYLEALSALYEAGGSLPADPAVLSDELLLPAKEIARCLPILDAIARSGNGRGGLLLEEGRISNGRITTDLAAEKVFRAQQAEYGEIGGAMAGKGRPKQAPIKDRATPNPPLPSPSPFPAPSPTPERTNVPCDHAFARKRFSDTQRTTVCPCGEEFRSVKANPFVPDRAAREALERESMRLTAEIAAITGEDGPAIFAEAAHYEGATRQKYTPATMTDERLLATVQDLRGTLKTVQAKQARKPVSA